MYVVDYPEMIAFHRSQSLCLEAPIVVYFFIVTLSLSPLTLHISTEDGEKEV